MSQRVVRVLAILLAVAAAGPLTTASNARAEGTYVFTCRAPAAPLTLPPIDDWHVTAPPGSTADTFGGTCLKPPLTLDMSGSATHPPDDYMHLTFSAPADTRIVDYVVWRSVQLADTYNYRLWQGFSDGTSLELDTCFTSRGCKTKGSAGAPDSAANKVCGGTICPRGRNDITSLMFSITCSVSSGSCPAAAPGARFQLHRADLRLVDTQDPVLTGPPTGALVAGGGPVSGVQSLSVSATDRGGGVYQVFAEIDGAVRSAVLDANGGYCRPPFRRAVPCRLGASGSIGIDTATLPDGPHSLRLWVSDVAGNLSGPWGPVEFTTANASCNPEPRADGLTMLAGFPGKRGKLRTAVTIRSGRRTEVTGQLLDAQRHPVAGAPVCVAVREAGSSAPASRIGEATTDAAGRVSVAIPAGSSRRIYVVHRVAGGAITGVAHMRVRAPVRLRGARKALRNGQSLLLRGRLGARPRPGVLVELQARRESGWQTFATTRTSRGGRFAYRYQFTRTTGVQRYRLRARVPGQGIYPFAPGASRPVVVTVRG